MRAFKIGLIPLLYKLRSRYLTRDAELDNIASTKGAYEYLKKYRQKVETVTNTEQEEVPVRYWTCWSTGENDAPKVVTACFASMRQYLDKERLTVLNFDTLREYVTIPDFIEEKYKKGIIGKIHLSDVLRLLLLEKYGGVWIDSTILLTGPIPEMIENSQFFVYRQADHGKICAASNFMVAKPHNPIVRYTLGMITDYWKNENKLVSYSLIHLSLAHAAEAYPELWKQIPYIPCEVEYLMNYKFNDDYSEELFKSISDMTSIHKLTYKTEQFKIDADKKGSLYDYVCNHLYKQ